MKKNLTFISFIIFAAILQTSFFNELFGVSANPNLVASFVFALVLIGDYETAYLSALLGGLFLDVISGGNLGVSSLLLCSFVWLFEQLRNFYLRNFMPIIVFTTLYLYIFKLILSRSLVFDSALLFGSLLGYVFGKIISLFLKGYNEKVKF